MSTVQIKRRMRVLIVIIVALVAVSSVLGIGLRVPEELDDQRITFEVDEITEVVVTIAGDDMTRDVEFFINSPNPGLQVSLGNGWSEHAKKVFEVDEYENLEVTMRFEGKLEELDWFWVDYGFMYDDGGDDDFGFEQVTGSAFEARVRCYGCDDDEDDGISDDTDYTGGSGGGGGGGGGSATLSAYLAEEEAKEESKSLAEEAPVLAQDIAGEGVGVDQMVAETNPRRAVPSFSNVETSGGDAVVPKEGKLLLMGIIVMLVIFMGFTSLAIKAVKEDEDL